MDHFENMICTLLEAEGYWVRKSFKVNLSKDEKRRIGKPSTPRPEIDLLAFKFSQNEVLAIEAKSYLDSFGVRPEDLTKEHEIASGRYKLFTSKAHRSVVLGRLLGDLVTLGMANKATKITLGLVVGKVYKGQSENIRTIMQAKEWFFWSPEDIREKVAKLAELRYENDPAIITAKILLRGSTRPKKATPTKTS